MEAKLEEFDAAARQLQEMETATNHQRVRIQELEAELAKEQEEKSNAVIQLKEVAE